MGVECEGGGETALARRDDPLLSLSRISFPLDPDAVEGTRAREKKMITTRYLY